MNTLYTLIKDRFICKTGRLISDIIKVTDNVDDFLVTMDIEKTFDLLSHFLFVVLKKFGLGKTFINWIEAILKKPNLV